MKSFTGALIVFLLWAGVAIGYTHYRSKASDTKSSRTLNREVLENSNTQNSPTIQGALEQPTLKNNSLITEQESTLLEENKPSETQESIFESKIDSANSRILAQELRRAFAISDTIDVSREEPVSTTPSTKIVWENIIVSRTFYPSYSNYELVLDKALIDFIPEMKSYLDGNEEATITIVGHTDHVGNGIDNFKAGLKKARQIKWYLSERRGISRDRIKAISRGELEPIESKNSAWGQQQNDRVEIIIG